MLISVLVFTMYKEKIWGRTQIRIEAFYHVESAPFLFILKIKPHAVANPITVSLLRSV
jgi:hypothetical protein